MLAASGSLQAEGTELGVARKAMTVLYWMRPVQRQVGGRWADTGGSVQTKFHVSVDGAVTACRYDIPPGATVVAVTPDWHERATCYNCVYRLWRDCVVSA